MYIDVKKMYACSSLFLFSLCTNVSMYVLYVRLSID